MANNVKLGENTAIHELSLTKNGDYLQLAVTVFIPSRVDTETNKTFFTPIAVSCPVTREQCNQIIEMLGGKLPEKEVS